MNTTKNKRIYVYLVLATVLVLGICIGGNFYLTKTANTIVVNFKDINKNIAAQNWEAAQTTFDQSFNYWNQHKKYWQMLIDHKEIDDIEISFLSLKGNLEAMDAQEANKDLYLLQYNILHVPATQSINAQNLL